MKRGKMILVVFALTMLASSALYAHCACSKGTVNTAVTPATQYNTMQRPVRGESVVSQADALYHYARRNEETLDQRIVEERIQGMDRGIARAGRHLASLERKVGAGNVMEREDLGRIRAHEMAAADALANLKQEAAESPMNDRAIERSAREIRKEMKMANEEARSLGIELDYRNPGATELHNTART